ncbi:asparaginase [Paenibacillus sp. GP183]|uniref:asparaginase n=1 Tax=Paenibacillus sp. GP183 TaxID=1882751 RepID=UPI00089997D0|nr:asparaginase [Paenibacillus sp. GP183]SEB84204.1 asparaginase [Paenibacillus sp. GP183]
MPAAQLVHVYRGPLIESKHYGHIAVVDLSGNVLHGLGDPRHVTFVRSSSKPLQAIPVVESGAADRYQFSQADLALCCASHNGEQRHTDRVMDMLARIGVPHEALQCGTHAPRDQDNYKKLIRSGGELTPIYNNCSGKHTGMLTLASHLGADLSSYRDIDHPVQVLMRSAVADMTDMPAEDIVIGIDGCGVPVFGVPLDRLALAFAKLSDPSGQPEPRRQALERITAAMMAHPEMVGGKDRFCTDLMSALPGRIIGKAGAEGVYAAGLMGEGIGIAVKVDDGNARAAYPTVVAILEQLGYLGEADLKALEAHRVPSIQNAREEIIGKLQVAFSL